MGKSLFKIKNSFTASSTDDPRHPRHTASLRQHKSSWTLAAQGRDGGWLEHHEAFHNSSQWCRCGEDRDPHRICSVTGSGQADSGKVGISSQGSNRWSGQSLTEPIIDPPASGPPLYIYIISLY